jgi:hypothetical protein
MSAAEKTVANLAAKGDGPTQENYEVYAGSRKKAANALLSAADRESARKAHAANHLKRAREEGKFRQLAENGNIGWYDQDIAYFLEDLHAGKIKRPAMPEYTDESEKNPTAADFLSYRFLKAVAENNRKAIRRIGDAVARVHARASGDGETFKIASGNLKRAQLLKRVRKEGISNTDQKDIRRVHKGIGGRTGKVGRPKTT